MNNYLSRKNVNVACVADSVWRMCQLLQQHLFQCLYNYNEKAEFDASIGIFGLKTPLHQHVIGEHSSMKNWL